LFPYGIPAVTTARFGKTGLSALDASLVAFIDLPPDENKNRLTATLVL
jgi:hypothetical protein